MGRRAVIAWPFKAGPWRTGIARCVLLRPPSSDYRTLKDVLELQPSVFHERRYFSPSACDSTDITEPGLVDAVTDRVGSACGLVNRFDFSAFASHMERRPGRPGTAMDGSSIMGGAIAK